MSIYNLLQIIPDTSELVDTTGKNSVEKAVIESFTKVSETPADVLFAQVLDKLITFGLKLLAAIAVYLIGGLIIKWIRKILNKGFSKKGADKSVASFITSLVTATLWVIVIIVAIGLLGIETTSIAALLAAGGVAIGMAMSGTVQNFAGGIMILAFKPFKVGDYIEAQGFAGTVMEMNITATKINTTDNQTIILPNGALSNGTIKNLFHEKYHRVDIKVSVEYGSDAEKVIALLLQIAEQDTRILHKSDGAPADPFVGLIGLESSSVDFIFRAWVLTSDYWDAFFALNKAIYRELPEQGISFPFQQLEVHMN